MILTVMTNTVTARVLVHSTWLGQDIDIYAFYVMPRYWVAWSRYMALRKLNDNMKRGR